MRHLQGKRKATESTNLQRINGKALLESRSGVEREEQSLPGRENSNVSIRNSATVGTPGIVSCLAVVTERGVASQDICALTFFYNKNQKKNTETSGLSSITALNLQLIEVPFAMAPMLRVTRTLSRAVLHAKLICS